ncbi:MAG: signal recognition particle-docking protein FtsY, partial [Spirochaetales bacterium]|nr:signal recognition particle-docking protein FtsY [Candidatus Physcosoma equi]
TLIEGALGAKLTDEISETLRKEAKERKLTDASELQSLMKEILSQYIHPFDINLKEGLNVFLILGVNGVGKTTSIAKISKYYTKRNKKVVLAAADTFRAAAVDQLDIHADRLGMRIVKQQMGSDPGAVVFDAVTSALAQHDDLVLADTAGRMHNKENLMRELQKIDKIVKTRGVKPENYKKFLVIDATTGQNGLSQAMLFNQAVQLDGVILTKYDSAAKGGALVQIGKTLNLPVAFVGTGEGYDDIHPFNKEEYLNALIGMEA